jgi:uncharacterized protein
MERSEQLTARLEGLAMRHRIRLILQFGSTVTGAVHSRSDIDIAILLRDGDVSFETLGEIDEALQQCFSDYEIDLAIINRADPLFLKKIMEQCRLLYGSIRDLQELKIYAFKRYQDHRRFLDLERQYAERTLTRLTAGS